VIGVSREEDEREEKEAVTKKPKSACVNDNRNDPNLRVYTRARRSTQFHSAKGFGPSGHSDHAKALSFAAPPIQT